MSEIEEDLTIGRRARTFVVTATAAGLTAFNVGFDLGAFENIDHRHFWAVWVICTVALVASYLFDDGDYRLGGRWRLALAVPTFWLIADFLFVTSIGWVVVLLAAVSLITVPFAIYVLVHLVAGDYIGLPNRLRIALVALTVGVFAVGLYVGYGHERFLTCDDFARAGEYQPDDCRD